MRAQSDAGLLRGLELVEAGLLRVDPAEGMVYGTVTTSLYTYERPVGALSTQGYVVLSLGRGEPQVCAHRLIWVVATGEMPTENRVINHKNGVKLDNRLDNLELVTQGENVIHAYGMGLIPRGEKHAKAKLSDEDIRRIFAASFSESATVGALADRFNVSTALVSRIWDGDYRWHEVA